MTYLPAENNWAVALLIINKVDKLPFLSINSIRSVCDVPIYVGYTNISDIESIKDVTNLIPVDLSSKLPEIDLPSSVGYLDYNNPDFYQLVQLKWHLFDEVLSNRAPSCRYLVYSDFDVCWLDNPENYLTNVFEKNSEVQICVQDASAKQPEKALCMGIVAFRNSNESRIIIKEAKRLHKQALLENPKVGDDWVISDLYSKSSKKNSFWLLPQVSFPVGLLTNAFLDRSIFSGLVPPKPFIFHANYLVGSDRKALLMSNIMQIFDIDVSISFHEKFVINIRKILLPIKRLIKNYL